MVKLNSTILKRKKKKQKKNRAKLDISMARQRLKSPQPLYSTSTHPTYGYP